MTEKTDEELVAAATPVKRLQVTFDLEDGGAVMVNFTIGEKGQVFSSADFFDGPLGQIMSMITVMLGAPQSGSVSYVDARTGESKNVDLPCETVEEKLNA